MLIIRQIEAPRPGTKKRTLTLSGTLTPIDELTFGGEQRSEVEWMPGGTRASVFLDGPEETPTDFQFRWRDRLFRPSYATLNDTPIPSMRELIRIADSMRRDTALVEVVWDGVTYAGVFKSFHATYRRRGVADVSITFEWARVPDTPRELGDTMRITPPKSFAAQLQADFDAGMAKANGVLAPNRVTFSRGVVDDVEMAVGRVRNNIATLRATANNYRLAQIQTFGVARSMASGIQEVALSSRDVVDALAVTPATLAQTDDAVMQLRAAAWIGHVGHAARGMRTTLGLERRRYRPATEGLLAEHTVMQGETLFGISALYYGHSVYAGTLHRRNKLTSSVLRAGQVLKIPDLGLNDAR